MEVIGQLNVVADFGQSPVIEVEGNHAGWYNITFLTLYENTTLNFDGFKFVGIGGTSAIGVGLYGDNNSCTISNCWITGNYAHGVFDIGYTGDHANNSLTLRNCRVFLTAHAGLVRAVHGGSTVTIDQCTIVQDPSGNRQSSDCG